jgi:hypothetical protein
MRMKDRDTRAFYAHTTTTTSFRQWRERQGYTLDGTARALGFSRRMAAYYEGGRKPIPRVVALATRALDVGRSYDPAA